MIEFVWLVITHQRIALYRDPKSNSHHIGYNLLGHFHTRSIPDEIAHDLLTNNKTIVIHTVNQSVSIMI